MQNLFSAAKEMTNIQMFRNKYNFTKIQEIFLSYLYFYYDIFQDVALKKIDKNILKNEIYEDAYIYWKKEKYPETRKIKDKKKQTHKNVQLVFSNNKSPGENK